MAKAVNELTDSSSSSSSCSSGAGVGVGLNAMPPMIVMKLSDLKMAPDNRQRDLILNDMVASRRKLEEENQRLRDELSDAQLMIRLLQLKLRDAKNNDRKIGGIGAAQTSGNSWFRAKEHKITLKDMKEFEQKTQQQFISSSKRSKLSRKEAFTNPSAPGRKVFSPIKSNEKGILAAHIPVAHRVSSASQLAVNKKAITVKPTQRTKQGVHQKSESLTRKSHPAPRTRRHTNSSKLVGTPDTVMHRSVMGKLTLSIIEENKQYQDHHLFMDGESDW